MIPTTAFGLFALVALVPGYFYLRLTSDVHRPTDKSAVTEVFELAAAGTATTGAVAVALALTCPGQLIRLFHTLRTPLSDVDSSDIRQAGALVLVATAVALTLAWLLSRAVRLLWPQRYAPSMMKATFGRVQRGQVPVVGIGLTDGTTIFGPLHSFSTDDDTESRAVALKAPMRREGADGKTSDLPVSYFVAFGSEIAHLTMSPFPDPGAQKQTPPGGLRRIKGALWNFPLR